MKNVVRPWSQTEDVNSWPDLIRHLFSITDRQDACQQIIDYERRPLSRTEDVDLVDDIIDTLMDPSQAEIARPMLRHVLKDVAKTTLSRTSTP